MTPCIEHTQKGNVGGYGTSKVCGRTVYKHRLVYALAHDLDVFNLPGLVLHQCDNSRCINPDHLELGTHKKNMVDMHLRGRAVNLKGEDHHQGKLTWEIVRRIRARYVPWCRINGSRAMGREFGVDNHTISEVVNHLIWKES